MDSRKNLVFILGISRTGSKFYMQVLNNHPDFFIAPEIVFQHPVKDCLFRDIAGLLSENPDAEEIYQYVVTKNYKDTYVSTVSSIEKQGFKDYLESLDRITELDVLYAILSFSSGGNGHIGAKFPVHYSFGDKLLRYFPECKIIYLTRDPRDIFCSDIVMKTRSYKRKLFSKIMRLLISPVLIVYTAHKWKKSLNAFDEWESEFGPERIRLFQFEDIASNAGGVLDSLSDFLVVERKQFALDNVKVVDSSFDEAPRGSRWAVNLTPMEGFLFSILVGQRMKLLGY